MALYPRIVAKDPQGTTCFAAEGKALETYFQIGVSANAAAAAPVRHETIKEALLAKAEAIMREAESSGTYDWSARGFELRQDPRDESGHARYWLRNYRTYEVCDLI